MSNNKTTLAVMQLRPVPLTRASLGRPWPGPVCRVCSREVAYVFSSAVIGKYFNGPVWFLTSFKPRLRPKMRPHHVGSCPKDAWRKKSSSHHQVLALYSLASSGHLYPQSLLCPLSVEKKLEVGHPL